MGANSGGHHFPPPVAGIYAARPKLFNPDMVPRWTAKIVGETFPLDLVFTDDRHVLQSPILEIESTTVNIQDPAAIANIRTNMA